MESVAARVVTDRHTVSNYRISMAHVHRVKTEQMRWSYASISVSLGIQSFIHLISKVLNDSVINEFWLNHIMHCYQIKYLKIDIVATSIL